MKYATILKPLKPGCYWDCDNASCCSVITIIIRNAIYRIDEINLCSYHERQLERESDMSIVSLRYLYKVYKKALKGSYPINLRKIHLSIDYVYNLLNKQND